MKQTLQVQINNLKSKLLSLENVAKHYPKAYYSESTNRFVLNDLDSNIVNNYDLQLKKCFYYTGLICNPYIMVENEKIYVTAHGWSIGNIYIKSNNTIMSAVEFRKLEKYSLIFDLIVKNIARESYLHKSKTIKFSNRRNKVGKDKVIYYESLLKRYFILV